MSIVTQDDLARIVDELVKCQSANAELRKELAESRRRETELQAEIERLLSLDGERCKSHNFYLIRSSRLEDEVARKQLDCDALNYRVKTLEDALEKYARHLFENCIHSTCICGLDKVLAAKDPK